MTSMCIVHNSLRSFLLRFSFRSCATGAFELQNKWFLNVKCCSRWCIAHRNLMSAYGWPRPTEIIQLSRCDRFEAVNWSKRISRNELWPVDSTQSISKFIIALTVSVWKNVKRVSQIFTKRKMTNIYSVRGHRGKCQTKEKRAKMAFAFVGWCRQCELERTTFG